jgi:hypothetical protein
MNETITQGDFFGGVSRVVVDDCPETWRVVIDYPKYECSSYGRIRNRFTMRVLKLATHRTGYLHSNLRVNGRDAYAAIHRLVAIAFLPNPCPLKNTQVNHIDRDKSNNRVSNLEWCSPAANMRHFQRTRRGPR